MSLAVASQQLWSGPSPLRATKRGDGGGGIGRMATGVPGAKAAPPVPHLQAHQPALRGQHVPHLPRPPLPPGGHNPAPPSPPPMSLFSVQCNRKALEWPERFSVASSHASDVLCFGVARNSVRWPHGLSNSIYIWWGRSTLHCKLCWEDFSRPVFPSSTRRHARLSSFSPPSKLEPPAFF